MVGRIDWKNISGLCVPARRETAPLPAPLERFWTKTGLGDLAEGGRPAYTGVAIGESKRKSRLKIVSAGVPSSCTLGKLIQTDPCYFGQILNESRMTFYESSCWSDRRTHS